MSQGLTKDGENVSVGTDIQVCPMGSNGQT